MTDTLKNEIKNRFTMVPVVIWDFDLSLGAVALAVYLMGKPDNWIVNAKDIQKKLGIGKDKTYSCLNELLETPFLVREEIRIGGKFHRYNYTIKDFIRSDLPVPAKPDAAKPDPIKPDAYIKLTTTKTDCNKNEEYKKYLALSGDSLPITAVELYNDLAKKIGLSKAQILSPARKKKLNARLKECDGLEGWKAALQNIEQSPFLTGANNRNWKADLDFILQPSKFIKIMEGGYSGGGKNAVMTAIDDLDKQINGEMF